MGCRDRIDDLCRHVDGELSGAPLEELRLHLADCDSCRDTFGLLLAEGDGIASALAGAGDAAPHRRSGIRSWIVAAVLLLVAGVGLAQLHGAYSAWAHKQSALGEAPDPEFLDQTVTFSACGMPLPDYLSEISRETGVRLVLSDAAGRRLEPSPLVDIKLSSPVRLGSILSLLHRFYELETEARGKTLVLQQTGSSP